jgi:hypothetical protein
LITAASAWFSAVKKPPAMTMVRARSIFLPLRLAKLPYDWTAVVDSLLEAPMEKLRLPVRLTLMSQFWEQDARTFVHWFKPEIKALQRETPDTIKACSIRPSSQPVRRSWTS